MFLPQCMLSWETKKQNHYGTKDCGGTHTGSVVGASDLGPEG